MRIIVQRNPEDQVPISQSWMAQAEWGPNLMNSYTGFGIDPLSATMALAEFVTQRLVSLEKKLSSPAYDQARDD
jgi:hypothetical protein